MDDNLFTLWEEPLYRFILQITLLEIAILGLIMLGVIITRQMRLFSEKRRALYAKQLFEPLMHFIAGDLSLDEIHTKIRNVPKRIICLELERYVSMLDGRTLSRIRALYERLDLRNVGIRLAGSMFWWRRLEGVRLLGATSGEDIVEILMEAIQDKSPVVRLAAVRSLGRIRSTKSIRPLLDMLSKAEYMSRRQLAQTLIAFGTDIQPFLKRILKETLDQKQPDPHFVSTVLEVLALTGDIDCEQEVKRALTSGQLEVRIAAFKAAALLHLPLTSDALTRGLEDDEWQVRAQAALAAGKLKDENVVIPLGACLSDRNWWVRSNAGVGLFSCGKSGIRELHRIAAESDDKFARDMAMKTLTSDPMYHVLEHDTGMLHSSEERSS